MSTRSAYALLCLAIGVIIQSMPSQAACVSRPAPDIKVDVDRTRLPAGSEATVRWSARTKDVASCRGPLFLVVATRARSRFTGRGFLAVPPGAAGPYGIGERRDETRVFIPLHAHRSSAAGSFGAKFYGAGEILLDWIVVAAPGAGGDRSTKVLARGPSRTIAVDVGKPVIVVRDAMAPGIASDAVGGIERPRTTIVSNSGEFELQVFEKFYRVRELRSAELVLERAGVHPNFSPSSRFIGAFAEGEGFEVLDLYADAVVVSSARLNRRGRYQGTAHVAAWSSGDAVLALSFWGWGGVYVQQTLVDRPGVGENASCHACQGIGVDLSVSLDTGLVKWSGQDSGWATLYEKAGSADVGDEALKRIPGEGDFAKRNAWQKKRSAELFADFGKRFLFPSSSPLPANLDARDGSAWRIGTDPLRLSHACTQRDGGECASLGDVSEKGRVELARLAALRVEHDGRKNANAAISPVPASVQLADARLTMTRAAMPAGADTGNVWKRLAQLGVPLVPETHRDLPIRTFEWKEAFDNPERITDALVASLPALKRTFVPPDNDQIGVPDDIDGTTELAKINPRNVRQIASWTIGDRVWWLVHADYQTGNSSTPQDRYLQVFSGRPAEGPEGKLAITDVSTRLGNDGTLARHADSAEPVPHPWPSNIDILRLVDDRWLLASGQWLHDKERWAIVYDLSSDKTVYFDGHLPDGNATTSVAVTGDAKVLIAASKNGRLHFWRMATAAHILSGNYVDDELVVFDSNGYFTATHEGAQFVFMKFPSLPGYLSFKQFAQTLQKPDAIKAILEGGPQLPPPALSPPPSLAIRASPLASAPGKLTLDLTVGSTRPLARLRLFLDGQPWSERTLSGRRADSRETIEVPPKSRWLTAIADDTSGSESVPVALALPQDDRPSRRRLFALAVGTDIYPRLPEKMRLKYAVSDARHFLSAVRAQRSGYYASFEAAEFFDAPRLKTELPERLRALARVASADDTIMLFASGHGWRGPDGRLHLLVAESEEGRYAQTSLSWDDLALAFGETRARIVVFIDACHSGAIPDGGSNDEIAQTLAARQVRFTVMAAAKGRQESFEKPELGGGVFTMAIVKAMDDANRSKLDDNGNGVVELTELYTSIKPAILGQMAGLQTPWLARTDMVGEIPLF